MQAAKACKGVRKTVKTGGDLFFLNKYTNLKIHINSYYEFFVFVILRIFLDEIQKRKTSSSWSFKLLKLLNVT